jgi:hypothetical protein
MKQKKATLTQSEVKKLLRDKAKDIGPAGWDQHSGTGIIRAKAAYYAIQILKSKWSDDQPVKKLLDDSPKLKFLDDPKFKIVDDPGFKVPGDLQLGGVPLGLPQMGLSPWAPFVLATPHHAIPWPSMPES